MSSKELEVGQAGGSRVAKQEMGCLAALAIYQAGSGRDGTRLVPSVEAVLARTLLGRKWGLKPGCTDGEDKSRTCMPERECGPSLSKSFLQVIGPYCHAVELPPCSQKGQPFFFLSLFKTKDFTLYITCVCLYMKCLCMCVHVYPIAHVWKSEDNFQKLVLSFHSVLGLLQQVLFPMSHRAGSFSSFSDQPSIPLGDINGHFFTTLTGCRMSQH